MKGETSLVGGCEWRIGKRKASSYPFERNRTRY